MLELIDEENWGVEDAIHEIVTVRNDVTVLMQPRPRNGSQQPNKPYAPPPRHPLAIEDRAPDVPPKEKGKGKGKNGRDKGSKDTGLMAGLGFCKRFN